MLWEKAESTAEFTYFMFYLKWCVDGFKQLNSTQLLKKNIYQKTVISEAFALLRSTAKLPAAARSSFVFLMKFHWQYWRLSSNQFRAQAAYFAGFIQCHQSGGPTLS